MSAARDRLALLASLVCLSCAGAPPRARPPTAAAATVSPDAGVRTAIPPSSAGPAPHRFDTVFAAADPALRLSRIERVDAIRAEALATGVDPAAVRVTDLAHVDLTLIGWTERDTSGGEGDEGERDENEFPAHAFAWLVGDDGAVLDLRESVTSADVAGPEGGDSEAPNGPLGELRFEGDPRHETARLVVGDQTLRLVRLARGRFTAARGCGPREIVAPSVCGTSIRCYADMAWQAIDAPAGELLTDDACTQAVGRITQVTEQALQGLVEATNAVRHEMTGSDDDAEFSLAPGTTRCRRVPASARAAARRRLVSAARQEYARGNPGGTDFNPADTTIDYGCIEGAGSYLAYVTNIAVSQRSVMRVNRGSVSVLLTGFPRHWMVVDLTGDGAPEVVFRDESTWNVLSPSWPAAQRFENEGSARSGRRFVVIADGPRNGLLLEGEVRAWNGQTFAPVTEGFDALRHALGAENAAFTRVEELTALVRVSTAPWSTATTTPCEDATRVAWAADVVTHMRDVGVPAADALRLASAPHGLDACPPASAWGRRVGAL
ncbi:MAG: hypothetical protein WCJ30_10020 [Deltaproteobacteria bacterium]